ncbi:MAG TPA: hypothetical protein VMS38_04355 [Pseudorhodoferax sp.]|nr:hypothetical protein [Pseudorhodoferax sp.]
MALALLAAATAGHVAAQNDAARNELVLGRYTTAMAQPPADLARPLDVVVALSFPRSTVVTVGDALAHALLRSGYRMTQTELGAQAVAFLALPLPESQRQVGPYRLQAVLDLLVGPAWQWHSDPYRRAVWFSPAGSAASVPQAMQVPQAELAAAQTFPVETPASSSTSK